jgi:CBS domain-containing protein
MAISAILSAKGHDVVAVAPDTPVREVVGELIARRIGAVLVTEEAAVVGVVSERDVIRGLCASGGDVLARRARDIMTSPVVTICPTDSVADAMALMTDRRVRHLPVIDGGRLVGLVSIGDLVKRRIEEAEQEATALKDYIATG